MNFHFSNGFAMACLLILKTLSLKTQHVSIVFRGMIFYTLANYSGSKYFLLRKKNALQRDKCEVANYYIKTQLTQSIISFQTLN